MRLKKAFNNNALLALDDNDEEVIVMGKGIAFGKKSGDLIDESLIQKKFVFDKSGELYVKVKTYKRADGSKTYPKTESIMRREAPVEEDSSQEQTADNNAAEGSSETSEEGTVSYDENTYSEDTYYNGSNDTSSQEDADIYQIPYGEEETYYTE